jgi:hypothetical protein
VASTAGSGCQHFFWRQEQGRLPNFTTFAPKNSHFFLLFADTPDFVPGEAALGWSFGARSWLSVFCIFLAQPGNVSAVTW